MKLLLIPSLLTIITMTVVERNVFASAFCLPLGEKVVTPVVRFLE